MNIDDLKRELAEEQTILRRLEENLGLESDLRERRKLRGQIEHTKTLIKGFQTRIREKGGEIDSGVEEGKVVYSSLPRLPYFFGREKELDIIAKAISPETRTWGVLIDGPGGIGKTSLAIRAGELAPAADFEYKFFLSAKVRELTPAGEQDLDDFGFSSYLSLISELANELSEEDIARLDPNKQVRTVLRSLAGIDALLIIDNVETFPKSERVRLYQFLARLPRSCKAIVTSRRRNDIEARIIRLDKLVREDAFKLLDELGKNNFRLRRATAQEREDLYSITNGNPLLMRWLVGQLGRAGSHCHTIADACTFVEAVPEGNDPLEYIFGDLLDTFTENETKVLTALVHFSQPAEVKWIADVADMAEAAARTALEDLADRALLVGDEALATFFLPPLAATFLRRSQPEAVNQTGGRLTDQVYALVLENGSDKYERFPKLEAEWPTIAAALPLFMRGENISLQRVCNALRFFLDFSGRWDEHVSFYQLAESKAVESKDFYHAGWRAYDLGWIHHLRGQALDTLACASRCSTYWEKSSTARANEKSNAIRLRGLGNGLRENYTDAIKAFEECLTLIQSYAPGSRSELLIWDDLGLVEYKLKDYTKAERNYREGLKIAEKINDIEMTADIFGSLAKLKVIDEDWIEAETMARKALNLAIDIGRQELIGVNASIIARALLQQGKSEEGQIFARQAVDIFNSLRQLDNLREARAIFRECGG